MKKKNENVGPETLLLLSMFFVSLVMSFLLYFDENSETYKNPTAFIPMFPPIILYLAVFRELDHKDRTTNIAFLLFFYLFLLFPLIPIEPKIFEIGALAILIISLIVLMWE